MCTLTTQMFTGNTIKPELHKCGLNPQMWTIVGEYHNYNYNNSK